MTISRGVYQQENLSFNISGMVLRSILNLTYVIQEDFVILFSGNCTQSETTMNCSAVYTCAASFLGYDVTLSKSATVTITTGNPNVFYDYL